jgi:hypothetical protein
MARRIERTPGSGVPVQAQQSTPCPWILFNSFNITDRIGGSSAYLVQTAFPGHTMAKQGSELAIARLHPEFAIRLAKAVREGRDYGLVAGIFSAYRPPAFGVGGFSDKFNSLHAYGLAVDLYGIGRPGSVEALWWHEIAAKHGLICPCGHHNKTEWNHCQPTSLRAVLADNLLRQTMYCRWTGEP